jgi:hypothetical protein
MSLDSSDLNASTFETPRHQITVATARPEDVFPRTEGGVPRGVDFEQLRRDAMTVTDAEIAHMQFAPWYSKFLVAAERERQRRKQQQSVETQQLADLEARVEELSRSVGLLMKYVDPQRSRKNAGLWDDITAVAGDALGRLRKELTESFGRQLDEAIRTHPARDGKDGKDGIGLAGGFVNQAGALVLTATDGSLHEAGTVVGRDGLPGRDGFGFDDLKLFKTGEREITLEFTKGEHTKQFSVYAPAVIYRGVYQAGTTYELGDVVSFGGSGWHCNAPTDSKPGNGNLAWTLMIKHGRDGKDGAKGEPGPAGPPGRDLTHFK